MSSKSTQTYYPDAYGKEEVEMMNLFRNQKMDAKNCFDEFIKPRLDRSFKLYIAYNGDRAKEIKKWQSNVFAPYVQAVVETMVPRILDARPDIDVLGRSEDDQIRSKKVGELLDFTWENAGADKTLEDVVRSSMIYGTGFLQTSWKKDVRTHKFLRTSNLLTKKLKWQEEERTFYDAPFLEWVDNYSLLYDFHNKTRETKRYWFKRFLTSGSEIKRKYPMYDKNRLDLALESRNSDLTDYAAVRTEVKSINSSLARGSDYNTFSSVKYPYDSYEQMDSDSRMHEVFEWTRPYDDFYAVVVNEVPILKGGFLPIVYDHKEPSFIDIPYLRVPGEFEGYGIPLILENSQILLNTIKNQRVDAVTLGIHKMWVVSPLANIKKEELITRPFGIIYSNHPDGVKPIEFSDVKQSAYREEDLLKNDMRYASGVDDASMGVGGGGSATEIRHLRESTLERVRLFLNHIGDGLSYVLRHWMSMYGQFMTDPMAIRILGDDGKTQFPLVEKDDVLGHYDFKATVIPSIAGKNDIEKKQAMDLFQLLSQMPFVDLQKLTAKVLRPWKWSVDDVSQEQQPQPDMPPMMPGMMPGMQPGQEELMPPSNLKSLDPEIVKQLMESQGYGSQGNPFQELGAPVDLLSGGQPPTVRGIPPQVGNPRGLNRGGKVNTNVNDRPNATPDGNLMSRVFNTKQG